MTEHARPDGRRRSPARSIAFALALVLAVVGAIVLGLWWLSGGLDAGPPPRDAVPRLPSGLSVAKDYEGCGSSSCFVEQRIVGAPGTTSADVLARLNLPAKDCGDNGWFDRRELCVTTEPRGDGVLLVVSLSERF